jgi:hypothetical protein
MKLNLLSLALGLVAGFVAYEYFKPRYHPMDIEVYTYPPQGDVRLEDILKAMSHVHQN